jgi:cell wall-associated NlpC family hydrolase
MTLVRLRPGILFVVAVAALTGACASTGATPRPFPTPGPRSPAAAPPPHDQTRPPLTAAPTPPTAGASPSPTTPTAPTSPATPVALDTYALTGTALTLRGTPYRNGGGDPRGFDCSGFTQYVFAQHGIALPREVKDQWDMGRPVNVEEIEPGDLMFFTTVAPGASHVAIALGGDEFVHAPSSTGVVRVERASSSYWAQRFIAARRIGN